MSPSSIFHDGIPFSATPCSSHNYNCSWELQIFPVHKFSEKKIPSWESFLLAEVVISVPRQRFIRLTVTDFFFRKSFSASPLLLWSIHTLKSTTLLDYWVNHFSKTTWMLVIYFFDHCYKGSQQTVHHFFPIKNLHSVNQSFCPQTYSKTSQDLYYPQGENTKPWTELYTQGYSTTCCSNPKSLSYTGHLYLNQAWDLHLLS